VLGTHFTTEQRDYDTGAAQSESSDDSGDKKRLMKAWLAIIMSFETIEA